MKNQSDNSQIKINLSKMFRNGKTLRGDTVYKPGYASIKAISVIIGKCCLIAAQAGISGSTKLGDGVVLGGQAGLRDNIEIGQGAMIGAQAGVLNSVPAWQKLAWTPALEWNEAMRIKVLTRRLPKLYEQLKQLSKKVEKLEAAENNKE